MNKENISLKNIFKRFKLKISFTFFLVIIESIILLLFPLFIGFAINDFLKQEYAGIFYLGLLGFASLLIGAGRRFFDTRSYSSIYTIISSEFVDRERKKGSSVSQTNARVGLLAELVEFLENSFPEIMINLIGLVGTLIILAFISKIIFISCLVVTILIIVVYALTTKRNIYLNKNYNDVLEKQVENISRKNYKIEKHFTNLMRWNIKLSDLETINFSIIWFFMIALLLFSIKSSVVGGIVEYGTIFSIIMYVFGYIENSLTLPLYYQQLVRLKEISERLNE